MGNVSSADHEKVNELLTRRAKKRISERSKKHQQQQQQQHQQQHQQQSRSSGSSANGIHINNNGQPMQRQKSSSRNQLPNPLDQAGFYSVSSTSSTSRTTDFQPQSPSSPSFSIPSSASTPTSSHYNSDMTRHDDMSASPTSPQSQNQYHSSPIGIPQHRNGHMSTNSMDETHLTKEPAASSPGAFAVKIVNNTCRNMSDYPSVPTLPSQITRSLSSTSPVTSSLNINPNSQKNAASKPNTTTSANSNGAHRNGNRIYSSAPIPNSRARGLSQPDAMTSSAVGWGRDDTLEASLPGVQSAQIGATPNKLVMSRSKLPHQAPKSIAQLSSSSPPLGSPLEASISNGSENIEASSYHPASSGPRQHRPSSTLSSLRSLLGNHPQGLSLIESLEDDDDYDLESLSDTETGDSEVDLIQRTQSLTTCDDLESDNQLRTTSHERRTRTRPPPQLDWMDKRRRFSSSSLSTISRDIQDSQKGQHALWKYIGGGNSHAPLRYDIERILDSGCGLGEWTMQEYVTGGEEF
ncbi:hypothetical protein BGZ46_000994 [Entomortierella lignicola]|nr:hypothetical protein BGZ46_000994 [Entomortierella lignicola]